MNRRQGFSLFEMLTVMSIMIGVIVAAGVYWGWNMDSAREQAYVESLEALLLRAQDYAATFEQPVAVCFLLSDGCMAEGVLRTEQSQSITEESQNWRLLEALPVKPNVFLKTNFNDQRLIIQSGGRGVRQPGTLYICSNKAQSNNHWSLVIARSGRITQRHLDEQAAISICGAG